MPSLLYVMLGGALGSAARHLTGRAMLALFGPGFPAGTLAVNLIGGFAMGLLAGTLARYGSAGEDARLFVGVGILGGFTTFSAFTLDIVTMAERGELATAALYILASVAGAIVALVAGLTLARSVAA